MYVFATVNDLPPSADITASVRCVHEQLQCALRLHHHSSKLTCMPMNSHLVYLESYREKVGTR